MEQQEPTTENEQNPADEFYAILLENFSNQFEDDVRYPGTYIKNRIHGLILRIR